MKYLIVTADDFGLTKSINEGIAKACREGIVNFLNFMPTGEAFDSALEFAKEMKLEEIGAHLSLTQTSPLTDPARIRTLVAKGGKFPGSYTRFLTNFFLGRIDPAEIYTELRNQLEALKKAGLPITCLSSHEHIHMVPAILNIFVALAREYKIPSIRCLSRERISAPVTMKKLYKGIVLQALAGRMRGILKESNIGFTDAFLGFLDSGNLQENVLLDMLKGLRAGTTELVCHPGFVSPEVLDRCIFHANCETELFALTGRNVKELVREEGIKLVKYNYLVSERKDAA